MNLFGVQIRADTAEYFYVFLQSKDIGFESDEIEEILLVTEWYFFFHFPSPKAKYTYFELKGPQAIWEWCERLPIMLFNLLTLRKIKCRILSLNVVMSQINAKAWENAATAEPLSLALLSVI